MFLGKKKFWHFDTSRECHGRKGERGREIFFWKKKFKITARAVVRWIHHTPQIKKLMDLHVSYSYYNYWTIKRHLNRRPINEYRCDGRPKAKAEGPTRLAYIPYVFCSYTLVNICFLFLKKNEPLGGFFTIKAWHTTRWKRVVARSDQLTNLAVRELFS